MKKSVFDVISSYLGNGEEDDNKPWMEHVDDSTKKKPMGDLAKILPKKLKGKPLSDSGVGPDLMDGVTDAPSRSKKDQSPTVNDDYDSLKSEPGYPIEISKSDVYKDDANGKGPLSEWWSGRRKQDDLTGHPLGNSLTGGPVEAAMRVASLFQEKFHKVAKSIEDIVNDGNNWHTKREEVKRKSRSVAVTRASSDDQEKKGLYVFKCRSASSGSERTTVLQFMRAPGSQPGDTSTGLVKHPVLVGCNCPSFLFWGPQYYAVQGKYMYMDLFRPSMVEPGDYIKGQYPAKRGKGLRYCKHVYAVSAKLAALKVDPTFNTELLNTMLRVKEPSILSPYFDADEWKDKYDLNDFNTFRVMVTKGVIPPDLQKEVDQLLRNQGKSMDTLLNFMNSYWKEWTEDKEKGLNRKEEFIKKIKEAPAAIIYILMEEQKLTKSAVSPVLIKAAFEAIRGVMDIGSAE